MQASIKRIEEEKVQLQTVRSQLQMVVRENQDVLSQLRSALSSERDWRKAAENTQEEVESIFSKERTEMQASVESLQEQLQTARIAVQEKQDAEPHQATPQGNDELGQLTSELSSERDRKEAVQNTLDEVELLLSKGRASQASVERLQVQLENEREMLYQQAQNEIEQWKKQYEKEKEHYLQVQLQNEREQLEGQFQKEREQLLEQIQYEREQLQQQFQNEREQLQEQFQKEREQSQEQLQNEREHFQEQFQNEREQLQEQHQNDRERLQVQLQNERGQLENVVRGKQEEVQRLQRILEAIQHSHRGGDGDHRRSWELSRDDINLSDHELGRGGWAVVKKAVFRGCPVAVKQVFDSILSPYNLRLFQREMSIASKCRHPCLLQFIGATTDEKPLIVTELLDTSLRTLLQQRSLQEKEAVEIALDVARGLNYLHLHKPPIIHRDVSSANILLWLRGSSYRAKVSDYGTANFMMACNTINPGAAVYSAPEAKSRSNQSTKLDIYSYGVLLCEMFIREFPSPHERERQVSLVTDDDIAPVIKACLRENPADRPDMNVVIEVLRGIASKRGFGEI